MLQYNVNLEDKTVLITGVAGFIGASLAKRLLDEFRSIRIVGIDSITDYYDVSLKYERLNELKSFGERLFSFTIPLLIKKLLSVYFQNIIHM